MQIMKRLMTQYMPGMLTCQQVDGFLFDFHEGKLSYGEQLKFKLHLSLCRECQAYLKSYKNTIRITQCGDFYNKSTAKNIDTVPEELVKIILKSRNNPQP